MPEVASTLHLYEGRRVQLVHILLIYILQHGWVQFQKLIFNFSFSPPQIFNYNYCTLVILLRRSVSAIRSRRRIQQAGFMPGRLTRYLPSDKLSRNAMNITGHYTSRSWILKPPSTALTAYPFGISSASPALLQNSAAY